MTSSVIVLHSGGNKALKVIVEDLTSTDVGEDWVTNTTLSEILSPKQHTQSILVHGNRRIKVKETGEFLT